ncbi:MAG: HEAT repeat domain-containing protein [Candidatus Aminicenantes bacterium]|nr:HEAT repeat domain-containing protein [Candidatus Aminicenantes bacterium]
MTTAALENLFRTVREGEDASTVRAAIMDLGYLRNPKVYPVLLAALDDPNPAVQHAAVVSLGRYGKPEAIEELVKPKIFRSVHVNIRWAAVAAVGQLGDYRVIDDLMKAVEDPEWIVRTQAVAELMAKVRDIIARRDVRLARVLIHMLSLDNEEIVPLAIEGLQEMGAETLPSLHEALHNTSATIRANAARALGRMRAASSAPYLIDLLHDDEISVRCRAAEALGLIGNKIAIEPLVLAIQDNVEKVRERAVVALVHFGKQATIPLLNALGRERDKFVQKAFLKCLGLVGDPKAAPALIGYLRSSYFVVRQAAVRALGRFGPMVGRLLLPGLSYNRSAIDHFKRDACDKMHPELQIRAIKALGGLEDHRAVLLLKEIVETGLPDVQEAATAALAQIGCAAWGRCCALKVLEEIGEPDLVPLIVPSLQDNSANARFEAVRAIARMGGEIALKHLVRIARKDCRPFIRGEAMRALRTMVKGQPEILKAALHGLKDSSVEVRARSARLLGNYQDPRSIVPLLRAMADSHWSVRENAENALLNFGRDAVPPLVDALRSRSWTMRFRAARLLGEIGDKRGSGPLRQALDRPRERRKVKDVAAASLRRLGEAKSS